MWCKNCLMQALDKKVHSARQHAVVFAISSLRILLFVGQGQLLQPFFRDTQRLFLYLLLVFLAQKVWPKKLGYFWYSTRKKLVKSLDIGLDDALGKHWLGQGQDVLRSSSDGEIHWKTLYFVLKWIANLWKLSPQNSLYPLKGI